MLSPHPGQLREFLATKLKIAKEDLPQAGDWAGSGNTLGSLALRMGMLSLDQIETIVELQVNDDARFGDTGVKLGFLTREQVDLLIRVQMLHRCIDLGAPLVVAGDVELSKLIGLLAEFFEEN